jgi:hypothetical protein
VAGHSSTRTFNPTIDVVPVIFVLDNHRASKNDLTSRVHESKDHSSGKADVDDAVNVSIEWTVFI